MKQAKFILAAMLTIAVIVVTFQAYSVNARPQTSTLSFSPSSNYPNPVNPNVTFTGVLSAKVVSPTCALNNPPCAMSAGSLYYITVNGANYRLIFPPTMKLPINGLHIMVTGTYVTPSTYQATQWSPQISFRGDIYVLSYTYVFPYA